MLADKSHLHRHGILANTKQNVFSFLILFGGSYKIFDFKSISNANVKCGLEQNTKRLHTKYYNMYCKA